MAYSIARIFSRTQTSVLFVEHRNRFPVKIEVPTNFGLELDGQRMNYIKLRLHPLAYFKKCQIKNFASRYVFCALSASIYCFFVSISRELDSTANHHLDANVIEAFRWCERLQILWFIHNCGLVLPHQKIERLCDHLLWRRRRKKKPYNLRMNQMNTQRYATIRVFADS